MITSCRASLDNPTCSRWNVSPKQLYTSSFSTRNAKTKYFPVYRSVCGGGGGQRCQIFHKPVKPLLEPNHCQMFRSNTKNITKCCPPPRTHTLRPGKRHRRCQRRGGNQREVIQKCVLRKAASALGWGRHCPEQTFLIGKSPSGTCKQLQEKLSWDFCWKNKRHLSSPQH